ncbi:hypothetical protein NPIL_692961 [Nephila pilipes]|uniref:Uncharacterized protein n=1 Tax=Nephila pilipes TaxID=299642 RepID=A0A8X6R2B9_NEPPI|nr:hypothetical protein NPIL_692961 [Nephila pilipes]
MEVYYAFAEERADYEWGSEAKEGANPSFLNLGYGSRMLVTMQRKDYGLSFNGSDSEVDLCDAHRTRRLFVKI